jgi:hypothetical protein
LESKVLVPTFVLLAPSQESNLQVLVSRMPKWVFLEEANNPIQSPLEALNQLIV